MHLNTLLSFTLLILLHTCKKKYLKLNILVEFMYKNPTANTYNIKKNKYPKKQCTTMYKRCAILKSVPKLSSNS